jgi:hypothetical protein
MACWTRGQDYTRDTQDQIGVIETQVAAGEYGSEAQDHKNVFRRNRNSPGQYSKADMSIQLISIREVIPRL